MKTIILLLLLAFTVSAQCPLTGKFGVRPQPAVITGDLYDQIVALPTQIEQKNFVATLSSADKFNVWQTHFERVLLMKDLSFDQRGVVWNVRNSITEKDFADRSLNPALAFNMEQAQKVFEPKLGKAIFYSIADPTTTTETGGTCDCREGRDWSCVACNTLPNTPNGCTHTDGGCGTLLFWDCTGLCADPPLD